MKYKQIVDRHLRDGDIIVKVDEENYSVEGTNKYLVNETCECPGFRFRRTCKHIEALQYCKANNIAIPHMDDILCKS